MMVVMGCYLLFWNEKKKSNTNASACLFTCFTLSLVQPGLTHVVAVVVLVIPCVYSGTENTTLLTTTNIVVVCFVVCCGVLLFNNKI